MATFDKILFPTDGSEFSAGAERVAFALGREGTEITTMTVVLGIDGEEGPNQQKAEAAATDILNGVEERSGGVARNRVIRFGADPYKEIVAEAEQSKVDAIVLGRRGKRGLAKLMLGDATRNVIGHAGCSVVVVPKACDMWSKRVLVATDGSRSSEAAVAAAARIAKAGNLPVTVVSVRVPHHSAQRQNEADRIVDQVLKAFQADGIKADGVVESGTTEKVITEAATTRGADLIIMGTHGRTGLGRMILGSNSARVIGQATCPVMVVKGG
ncbi:MAG: universal stress protein [Actinomycetota bacterium]